MASLIPLLMQMAPSIIGGIGKIPEIVSKIGHVVEKTVEGVEDVMDPEYAPSSARQIIRTVDGPREKAQLDSQQQQEKSFEKSRQGISESQYYRTPRYERSVKPRDRRRVIDTSTRIIR